MSALLDRFVDPAWDSPLDAKRAIAAIPAHSEIAGMFFLAVLEGAKRRNVALQPARERYLPFGFYPIVEFAPLLVAAAERFYPGRSLRQALRVVGQSGPEVFRASVLGKVTLGAAEGVEAAVRAIANTYSINIRPSRCFVAAASATSLVVSLNDVHHFLDSHHVGVFEGTLRYAGVNGRVRIASHSVSSADLLVEWSVG